MSLTFEIETWWSESDKDGNVVLHEPRLVLYDNGDQGQTEVASILLGSLFEAWVDWEQERNNNFYYAGSSKRYRD